jgi:o-succinylbenzoate synthase
VHAESTITAGAPAGHLERAREIRCPLRLTRAEAWMLSIPMVTAFRSAYGRSASLKRLIVVRLEDSDGTAGWGEAPIAERPVYCSDTAESTWSAVIDLLVPAVFGRQFSGPAELARSWADLIGQSYAKNAVESAVWAITSAKLDTPLAGLWGGTRAAVPVGESFPICDSIEVLLAQIEARLREGFGRVKLKIAPGWDVAAVSAVRERYPGVPLSVDANCGYTPGAGPWEALDEYGLVMIEQPFAGDALIEMSQLQQTLRTPICLDESASSWNTVRTALKLAAGRIVNIKPPRLGGMLACLAVHDLCASCRVPAWCGGTLETGIGRGFNLALAALPGFTLHSDMSPARIFYAQDLVEPTFDVGSDGCIAVPTRPGNGFPVVPERVAASAIRRWTSDTEQ